MIGRQHRIALMWAVALVFYVACWFLPIVNSDEPSIGYDGAVYAHEEFLRLIENFPPRFDNPDDLFGAIFQAIGWMANELFVLGLITLWRWPKFAVRSLALSLGIMISWQVRNPNFFPLLIGYWLWVAAGAIVLWLSAERLVLKGESSVFEVLTERVNLSLMLFPIVNSAILVVLALTR
jgi:hypothetical protein